MKVHKTVSKEWNLNKGGPLRNNLLHKTQKKQFPLILPVQIQRVSKRRKKLVWRLLAKQFQKSSLPRLFHSNFRKSRSLRENGQMKKNLITSVQKKNTEISTLNKTYDASIWPNKRER